MLTNWCDGWTQRSHIYNGDGKLRNMNMAGGYLVVLCPDCFRAYRESKSQELRQEIGPMEPGEVGCEKCNRTVRQDAARSHDFGQTWICAQCDDQRDLM